MADTIPPISVSEERGVRIIEFTNSKILDEGNIKDIGDTLGAIIDENENPKLLLDFSSVDHLSSAALGMLINVNNKVKQYLGEKGPVISVDTKKKELIGDFKNTG